MFGGSIEENIDPVRKILEDPRKRTKEGKKKKQDDRERLGKRLAFLKPTQKAQIGPSAVTDR